MSASSLRRLSLIAWLGSIVLIVAAGVLLVIGGGQSVSPGDVDLSTQRDGRARSIGLGVVGLVAILGAMAFAAGAWARMQADEVERREAASGFGVRPRRPGCPRRRATTTTSLPPTPTQTRRSHDRHIADSPPR